MSEKPKKIKLPNRTVIHTLDLSPDGEQLVVGQDSSKAHSNLSLRLLPDLKLVSELEHEKHELMLMARYFPDGKTLAYVDSRMVPQVFDLEQGSTSQLKIKNSRVQWLAPALKGSRLVLSGALTQVWDNGLEKIIWVLPGQVAAKDPDQVPAVAALHPNGKQIAVAGAEKGCIQIYDLEREGVAMRLEGAPDQARWVSYDPHARYIAAIEWLSHGIFLWDLKSGKPLLPDLFGAEFESYWCLRFDADGRYLALGMLSGFVLVVRLADGKLVLDKQEHRGRVWDLVFTPDGKQLISGGDDATLCLWDLS
jgi:WD40 repeat protein